MMIDEGSQLVKGCENMEFSFRDAQHRLSKEVNVEFDCCPVGGHNVNGRVERKIRSIKESMEKSVQNERLSIIQWETLGASIANAINDLPIAKGNIVSDLEHLDLITPNRLKLGRNNSRSPDGLLLVTGNFDKILNNNMHIFNAKTPHVPKTLPVEINLVPHLDILGTPLVWSPETQTSDV